ncbi:hypothetical protein D3C86_1775990 [compost metagenome]
MNFRENRGARIVAVEFSHLPLSGKHPQCIPYLRFHGPVKIMGAGTSFEPVPHHDRGMQPLRQCFTDIPGIEFIFHDLIVFNTLVNIVVDCQIGGDRDPMQCDRHHGSRQKLGIPCFFQHSGFYRSLFCHFQGFFQCDEQVVPLPGAGKIWWSYQ